jgi:hypothetical protein
VKEIERKILDKGIQSLTKNELNRAIYVHTRACTKNNRDSTWLMILVQERSERQNSKIVLLALTVSLASLCVAIISLFL